MLPDDVMKAVESEAFGAMNHALCSFAMRWEIDGDYMRCRKCKRAQITNWLHADFPHADDCKVAGMVEKRPWKTFIRMLEPITAHLSENSRG